MLHDGHELDGVVAEVLYTGQNVIGKFPIGPRTVFLGRHAHMGFIDKRNGVRAKVPVGPGKVFRKTQLPAAVFHAGHGVRRLVPVIEIPHQVERVGSRSPFAVDPAVQSMMKAVVLMRVGEVRESAVLYQHVAYAAVIVHAQFDIPLEGNQCPILLKNPKHEKKSPSMLTSAGETQGSSRAREELR